MNYSDYLGHNPAPLVYGSMHSAYNPLYSQFPYCFCPFFIHSNLQKGANNDQTKQQKPQNQYKTRPQQQEQSIQISGKRVKRETKKQQLKKQVQKNSRIQMQIQHPEIGSKFSAQYFDPTRAPLITSFKRNRVINDQDEIISLEDQSEESAVYEEMNEVEQGEMDSQPFIVFKWRRAKKRFRSIMKNRCEQESSYYQVSVSKDEDEMSELESERIERK